MISVYVGFFIAGKSDRWVRGPEHNTWRTAAACSPAGPGLAGGGRTTGQESHMAWCVGQELLMFVQVLGR